MQAADTFPTAIAQRLVMRRQSVGKRQAVMPPSDPPIASAPHRAGLKPPSPPIPMRHSPSARLCRSGLRQIGPNRRRAGSIHRAQRSCASASLAGTSSSLPHCVVVVDANISNNMCRMYNYHKGRNQDKPRSTQALLICLCKKYYTPHLIYYTYCPHHPTPSRTQRTQP